MAAAPVRGPGSATIERGRMSGLSQEGTAGLAGAHGWRRPAGGGVRRGRPRPAGFTKFANWVVPPGVDRVRFNRGTPIGPPIPWRTVTPGLEEDKKRRSEPRPVRHVADASPAPGGRCL